jgi:transcriptional regulator with XRE-family HTH domain
MSHPPSPSQHRLIAILRDLREASGMSTYQLADALGWSQAKVSRAERGEGKPVTADDAEAWAEITGAVPAVREELSILADATWTETRSWRTSHRSGLAFRQREMGQLDHRAAEIMQFQPEAIPGLLQSENYARRVLAFADVTAKGGVDAAAKARVSRQAVLREPGRAFDFVLGEGALRWRPGPRELMEEQLGHLLAAAALPSVSLSIIPFDREAVTAYQHAFTIYRIPDAPVVLVENYHAETFVAEPGYLAVYERTFAALRASAVHGDEATAFARSVILG